MVFDQNILDAISSTSDPQTLGDSFEQMNKGTLYGQEKTKFLSVCDEWYKVLEPQGLMDVEKREMLRKWIIERQYANTEDSVVSFVIAVCSIAKKYEKEKAIQQRRRRNRELRREKKEAKLRRETLSKQNKDLIYCRFET